MSPTAKKVWVVLIVFVALVTEISYNFADSKLHSEEFRDHFRKNYVYKKTEDENIFAIKRENYLGRGNVGGSMYNKQLSYTFCSDNPDSLIFKEEMMEEIYLTSSYLFDHYISKSTEMTDADNYVGMDRLFDDYHEKTYANHSYSDRWKRDKANKVFRNAKITVNNEKTKDEVYTRSVDGKVFYMKDYVFDLKMNASDLDWLESIGYDSVSIKYTKDRYSIIDVGPTTIVRSSMAPSLNMYEANLTEKNVRRNSNDYLMPMATKWIGKDEKSGNPKMVAVSLKAMEDVKVNTAFVKYYISSDWGSGFTCKIHFNVLNSILINKSMCEIDFDKIESEYPLLTKKFKTDYNVNYYEDYKKDTENWLYDLKKGEVYTVVMPVSEKSLGIMDNFCMVLASTKGETEVELKYDYSSADFTDEQIIDSMSENAVFNGVYERK